jgi:outer membrane protein TolC
MFENDFSVAVMDVKAQCGIDLNARIDIADDELLKEKNFMDLSLERYKDLALKKRPEVNALEALVFQAEYADKAVKADRWPGISMEGTLGKSGEAYVQQDLIMATEWSVFCSLQWLFWGSSIGFKVGEKKTEPSAILDTSIRTETTERFVQMSILDKLDYFYQRQERIVSSQQSIKDLEDIRKKVVIEVEKSYNNLQAAIRMIELAKRKLDLNKKKVAIIEKKNFLGEATSKETLEARLKAVQQRNALVEAIAKHNVAIAELKHNSGIDIYPLQNKENDEESEE